MPQHNTPTSKAGLPPADWFHPNAGRSTPFVRTWLVDAVADQSTPNGLGEWFPHLRSVFGQLHLEMALMAIAIQTLKPRPSEEEQGF